jgi:hypothetical protein
MAEKNPIPAGKQGRGPVGSVALALVLLTLPLACVSPSFRGYQIQAPPEGFLYDANSTQAAMVFPEREVINHGAWWRMSTDDRHASISITRFRGAVSVEDVETARDLYEALVAQSGGGEVSQLQFHRIDGREAWGWEEHRRLNGEVRAVASRTVVLYDTMAVALEFYSDMPEWMDPVRQEAALASFAYGETRILWGWVIAILAVVGGLIGGFIRHVSRTADKPLANTEYKLPSIPKGGAGEQKPTSTTQGGEGVPGSAGPPTASESNDTDPSPGRPGSP